MKEIYLDGIIYELNDDNESYGVKEYVGTDQYVKIKEKVNGKFVTEIHYHAFANANTVISITVPDSIRYVDWCGLPDTNLIFNRYENGLYLGNDNNPYVVFIKQETSSKHLLKLHNDCKVLAPNRSLDLLELYIPEAFSNIDPLGLGVDGFVEKVIIDPNNPYYKSPKDSNVIIRICDNTLVKAFNNPHIPDGVKVIGSASFVESNIKSIIIPNSVEVIEEFAFEDSKIRAIDIPSSVKTIKKYAFFECFNLAKVTFNYGIERIEESAFYRTAINTVSLPSSIKYIEESSFDWNTEVINSPGFVKNTEENSNDQSNFEIQKSIELDLYNSNDIELNNSLEKLLLDLYNPRFTKLAIPNSVKYLSLDIEGGNIEEIVIPNSIEYIKKIKIKDTNVKFNKYSKGLYLGNSINPYLVFYGIDNDSTEEFEFHKDTKFIAKGINQKIVNIPEGIIEICEEAFYSFDEIEEVYLPNSLIYLEHYSFSYLNNLKRVYLPKKLIILKTVFSDCPKLLNIYNTEALKYVAGYAFTNRITKKFIKSVDVYIEDNCYSKYDDRRLSYYAGFHNEIVSPEYHSAKDAYEYFRGINDRFLIDNIKMIIFDSIKNNTIEENEYDIKLLIDELYDLSEISFLEENLRINIYKILDKYL